MRVRVEVLCQKPARHTDDGFAQVPFSKSGYRLNRYDDKAMIIFFAFTE